MTTIKAHFDGKVFVPDEPVAMRSDQRVLLRVEAVDQDRTVHGTQQGLLGAVVGEVWMSADFNAPLDEFKDYQ